MKRDNSILHLFNYTELTFEGVGLIMSDVAVEYKNERKYGKEVRTSVLATNFDRIGFDIFYKLEVKSGDDWLLAGKVKTGMVCFDYVANKRVPVPAIAAQKMNN